MIFSFHFTDVIQLDDTLKEAAELILRVRVPVSWGGFKLW